MVMNLPLSRAPDCCYGLAPLVPIASILNSKHSPIYIRKSDASCQVSSGSIYYSGSNVVGNWD